uniref:Serpin B8 n=1 Tax=Caligus clemensi TaxID=344056 RepID=C1C2T6_CALCM|nr:Serpin B8 [Caligus clemensi]
MKTRLLALLFVFNFLGVSFGRLNLPDDEILFLQARLRPFRLTSALGSFTRRTYDLLSRSSLHENLVFSPFSVHAATSMLFYGSQENSTTFEQLSDLLGLQARENYGDYLLNYLLVLLGYEQDFPQYVLNANRLYVDETVQLEPNFQGALERFYRAEAMKGNFATQGPETAREINDFIKNVTRGNIDKIIDPLDIDELTRLVIINAIYFKGAWLDSFDPKDTRPGTFTLASRQKVTHPKMMNRAGIYWISDADPVLGVDIIDIPYENQDFSMLLFIPNDPNDYSLTSLVDKLFSYEGPLFDDLYRRMINRKVNVTIPSFEIESSVDIAKTFIALGVTDVFDPVVANLYDISTNYKDLHVDYIRHKAHILVNEEGTEASGATAIIIGTRSSQSIISLSADRPFIYMIVDKRYNIALFMGKYMTPDDVPPPPSAPQNAEELSAPNRGRTDSSNTKGNAPKAKPGISFPFRARETLVLKKEHVIVNE